MLSIASKISRGCLSQGPLSRMAVTASTTTTTTTTNSLFGIPQIPYPNQSTSLQPTNTTATTTCIRWKHSERQIKRLFRKHPAILRVNQRLGNNTDMYEPIQPLKFEPIWEPTFLQNGWSAPPSSDVQIPEYPFMVRRTSEKPNDATGFLPVYSNVRKDGSKITTRIKKVTGDRDLFIRELRSVLALPPPKNGDPRLDAIRIRVGGTIEVKGNRTREVKLWLAGLGF